MSSNTHSLPTRVRRLLIVALIAIQVLTTVGILVSSHATSVSVLLAHSEELLAGAADVSVSQTEGFLEPAARSAHLTAQIASTVTSATDLEPFLMEVLEANEEFDAVYFADLSGNFIFVANDQSIRNSATRTKVISPTAGSVVWWRNDAGLIIDRQLISDDSFNAVTRPWFVKAAVSTGPVWTDVYTFFSSQKPGITVSESVRSDEGVLRGVVGVDIGIVALSEFLGTLDVGTSGSAFIVDDQSRIVALPDAADVVDMDGEIRDLTSVRDPLTQAAYGEVQALGEIRSKSFSAFEHSGDQYLAVFAPIAIDEERTWTLAVYAPEDDFVGSLQNNERLNVALAMIISAVLIAAGLWVAKRVTLPVEELKARAETDPLTGLFDRRHFMEIAGQLATQAAVKDEPFCVALLDIDRFKVVNDTYGHGVGDEVLMAVSERLSHALRENDLVARFGGEEFALALPKSNLEAAFGVIDRLRLGIGESPIRTSAGPIKVTFSAGVAELSLELADVDALLLEADTALYRAKDLGRNCVVAAGI